MREGIEEAPLRAEDAGLVPDGDGWFIVNVAEASGMASERFGSAAVFEGRAGFPEFGINVRLLAPGQPASMYHREDVQEAFLVLDGECVAIVEDEERPMGKGDLLHCPAGTAHVIVGAGDGPAVVLMVGARRAGRELSFPAGAAAARHGASVEQDTDDAAVAYAGTFRPVRRPAGIAW
jgi:uncharacterized cupin superfamily protein